VHVAHKFHTSSSSVRHKFMAKANEETTGTWTWTWYWFDYGSDVFWGEVRSLFGACFLVLCPVNKFWVLQQHPHLV